MLLFRSSLRKRRARRLNGRTTGRPAPRCQLRLEVLEDRTVPSGVSGLHGVPSPAVNGSLSATAVIAPNDIWAVGGFAPPGSSTGQPLAEHFNGTSWSVVPTPAISGFFSGVAAVSSNDVWAVGQNASGTIGSLIEHWNGSTWSIVPAPAQPGGGWLNAVTAISATNVWAVGFSAGHNLIEHFDGTSWSIVSSPALRNSDLFGISGTSANDIWAVGLASHAVEVLHFNGTAWSAVATPNPTYGSSLLSVTAVAPNNAWAVGQNGSGQSLIEHWDGTSWSIVASPSFGTGVFLRGVAAVSANNIWAVGYTTDPTTGIEVAVTEHWDGASWSIVPTPSSNQNQALFGVAVDSLGDVVAVGQTGNSSSNPLILHS